MASKNVYFYNSKNKDRPYNADSFTDWLSPFFTTGVFNGCFFVEATGGMKVAVAGGYANVNSKVTRFIGSETLDLEVASGTLSRIDNVILRRDDPARDIYLMIETGGLARDPVSPPLMRQNGIYDLKLAEIRVSKGTIKITQAEITDTRMDKAACGWVMATVKEIDFAQITGQFNAFFAIYKPKIEREYTAYLAEIQQYAGRFQADTAVQYQDFVTFVTLYQQQVLAVYSAFCEHLAKKKADSTIEYDRLMDWFEGFKASSGAEFVAWFESIKGILGEDEAGRLLLLIEALQKKTPTAVLGRVSHPLGRYPHCHLYSTSGSFGLGGFGCSGYGGGDLTTLPHECTLEGVEGVMVKTIPAFGDHKTTEAIAPGMYGFFNTHKDDPESLILLLQ